MEKILLNSKEAAELLSIGRNSIQTLCSTGHRGFPVVRIERKYLINKELLIQWAAKVTVEGGEILP